MNPKQRQRYIDECVYAGWLWWCASAAFFGVGLATDGVLILLAACQFAYARYWWAKANYLSRKEKENAPPD